jgi:iron complex outermembrane recepter protein
MFQQKKLSIAIWQVLSLGVAAAVGVSAVAQTATTEKTVITGSNIKRVDAETSAPITVITREDIQRSGVATVEQLLQTVSAVASSGALAAASASGATTGGISSTSLRGLSALRTLVLINGRRVSPYGIGFTNDSVSVDINSIPLAAVERVEILKDGASAIYGSDAIAGVINFILRRDFTGGEATVEYGDTKQGGGKIERVSGAVGFGDLSKDRFNVMILGSYQKESSLIGGQRAFASSGINVGALNDTTSGNTFPANFQGIDPNAQIGDQPVTGTRNPGYPDHCGPVSLVSPVYTAAGLINRCRFDPSSVVTLIPETKRGSVYTSATFRINSDWDLYAEASYNKNESRTIIQPTPISDQFTIPLNNPLANTFPYNGFTAGERTLGGLPYSTIILKPTSPYYPTAYVQAQTGGSTPDLMIRWRAVDLGNRDLTNIGESPRLVLGVKGAVAGWDIDSAFLYSGSKVSERTNGGFALFTKVLPLLNSGTVNFFGPNTAATAAAFDATQYRGDTYQVKTDLTSLSAKASKELMPLAGGSLAFAVGGEFRKEKYNFDASTPLQQGDLSGYGGNFATLDKDRNVWAVFGELSVPFVKSVEATVAVRFDDYQGVGSSTTPKLGLRWTPTKELLFRASAGQGFRAPSLADLYSPKTTGVSVPGLNDPIRCPITGSSADCGTQFPVTNAGNPQLKSEKSNNYTLGFVFEPTPTFSVAVDAFRIELKNTISNGIPAAFLLSDPVRYAAFITRAPSSDPSLPGPIIDIDQTNLNTGRTNLDGFDLDTRMNFPMQGGKLTVGLAGTYFFRYDTENPDGTFSTGVDQVNTNTGGLVPRWKHRLSFDWQSGPWTLTIAQNFQKSYTDLPGTFEDPTDPAFKPRKVGAYETYDIQSTYEVIKGLRLTVGARNIFDRDPPYTNAGGQVAFQSGYDPQYGDPRGRFVYGRVSYAFK